MKKEDIFCFVFRVINNLIPKKENQILFESIPDFADNANSFFHYLENKNKEIPKKYSLIWLINDKKFVEELNKKGIKAYSNFSFKGLYYLLRSKYLFLTHNTYARVKSKNQILINLWHGMPLKAIGFMENFKGYTDLSIMKNSFDADDVLIATSTVMKSALASCVYTDPRKIHLTGQPRNDKLFKIINKNKLSKLLKLDLSKYENITIFCPTFRIWDYKNRVDGIPKKGNIFNFENYNETIFNKFLNENKMLLLLKFHPFEEKYFSSKLSKKDENENIQLITNEMLQRYFLDLYDILGIVDILITDYSSVYFDFLILNRPIIFTPTDLDVYSKKRGFLFEPYNFWTPGPKVINFNDFIKELKMCINNPNYYEKERITINNIVNKYQDDRSCERIYDLVFGNK